MWPRLAQMPVRSACPNIGILINTSRITPQVGIDLIIFMIRCSVNSLSNCFGGLQAADAPLAHQSLPFCYADGEREASPPRRDGARSPHPCSPFHRARRGIPLGVAGFLLELEDGDPWRRQVLRIRNAHG